jgi:hypothetical protein
MADHPAFDLHSCEGRRRFSTAEGWSSSAFAPLLSRFRQRAACAAGVSNGCRRSSHFSLAGPREK